MEKDKTSEKIIGGAFNVFNTMGFGFLESVYENCLKIEMDEAGIPYENQAPVEVSYKNQVVGDFVPDFIVEDELIVELKSVSSITPKHETQVVNYLNATGKPVGLLINFGENGVEVKRKYKDRKAIFENSVD